MSDKKIDFYLGQVRRLGGLEFTPQTPEAWAELAKTLRRGTKTEDHARRVIDRFTEPGAPDKCPAPGTVAQMCLSVPVDAAMDRPELAPACGECESYGGLWRFDEQRQGLERCGCLRGLKLAAMDAARKQEAPAKERKSKPDFQRAAAGDTDWTGGDAA